MGSWLINNHLNYFKHIRANTTIHHHPITSSLGVMEILEHLRLCIRMASGMGVTAGHLLKHPVPKAGPWAGCFRSVEDSGVFGREGCECIWSDWIDVSYPNSSDVNGGDYETLENIQTTISSWNRVSSACTYPNHHTIHNDQQNQFNTINNFFNISANRDYQRNHQHHDAPQQHHHQHHPKDNHNSSWPLDTHPNYFKHIQAHTNIHQHPTTSRTPSLATASTLSPYSWIQQGV
ncbi:hypothetical protein BTVI_01035 [Pitangus sulphuratus]|nr:hypothetical protein BTVI_01035 [Pitangus sulphuratus]